MGKPNASSARLASITKEFSANTLAGGAALMTKTPGLPLRSFTVAARRSWIDGRTGTTQRSEASIASLAVRSPGVSMKTHRRFVALMIVATSRGLVFAHSGKASSSGLDWNHWETEACGSTSKMRLSPAVTARDAHKVDFPTPPFWLAKLIALMCPPDRLDSLPARMIAIKFNCHKKYVELSHGVICSSSAIVIP